jgi:hypothetical protein
MEAKAFHLVRASSSAAVPGPHELLEEAFGREGGRRTGYALAQPAGELEREAVARLAFSSWRRARKVRTAMSSSAVTPVTSQAPCVCSRSLSWPVAAPGAGAVDDGVVTRSRTTTVPAARSPMR